MERIITDDELIYLIRQKNEKALSILLNRYLKNIKPAVQALLSRHKLTESEDANQVATIGIIKAIDIYRRDKMDHFKYFALLIADREVRTLLRIERQKGIYINDRMLSIDRMISDNNGAYFYELIPNQIKEYDPEYVCHINEIKEGINACLNKLSEKDKRIFDYWLLKVPYKTIARILNCPLKEVDVTIQKVKSRIRKCVDYQK